MRTTISKAMLGLAAMALALGMSRPASAGSITYISVGDTVAFGATSSGGGPSYGDRGYVSLVADKMGANQGGARPNVINLAIPGETTASFFGGGSMAAPQNLNYANTVTSQSTMLISKIASEQAAGNTIGAVSISLGASDLFALTNSASFQAMSPVAQQSALLASMSTIQNNYTTMLTLIKALAPSAQITLVGAYNPAVLMNGGGSPVLTIGSTSTLLLDAVIAGQAAAFGANFVDTASLLKGNPGFLNGEHPSAAGYAAIASGFNTVPEPTTLALLGTLGLGLAARRRRARIAA